MRLSYVHQGEVPSIAANAVHVVKMCEAFARQGADVSLIAPRGAWPDGVEGDWAFFGVSGSFEFVPRPSPKPPAGFHRFGLGAVRTARGLRADAVYTRSVHAAFYARMVGLPVTLELHSLSSGRSPVSRAVATSVIRDAGVRLVTISEALRDAVSDRFVRPAASILVAHDAADPEPADVPAPSELSDRDHGERLRVGYIGHLYPGKGMELIERLAPECPWAHFYVVGGHAEHLRSWRDRIGHIANVEFCGHVSPGRTPAYRSFMDVLIAPYQASVKVRGDHEIGSWMSPLKLFEYMASGKLIICSDLPVLREVLADGENALLCTPDDVAGWKSALQRARDPVLRKRIGERALQQFLDRHTWSARARLLLTGWP